MAKMFKLEQSIEGHLFSVYEYVQWIVFNVQFSYESTVLVICCIQNRIISSASASVRIGMPQRNCERGNVQADLLAVLSGRRCALFLHSSLSVAPKVDWYTDTRASARLADANLYAHHVFRSLDSDVSGALNFEVRTFLINPLITIRVSCKFPDCEVLALYDRRFSETRDAKFTGLRANPFVRKTASDVCNQ